MINFKQYISEKYIYDDLIAVNISKTGINNWSVSGDIQSELSSNSFNDLFMNKFMSYTNLKVNKLLKDELINTEELNLVNVSIQNINNYEDYKKSKEIIEALVTAKDIYINKFNENTIYYEISIFGNINSLTSEVSSNNFLQIKDISVENSSINLSFIK